MNSFGLATVGKDVEVRYMQNASGEAVANIALAFKYGKKGENGHRPTQWVDAAIFGKRAEALAPYLTKGTKVAVTLAEVHTETYDGRDGKQTKLVGRIEQIELAGSPQAAPTQAPPAPRPAPRPAAAPPARTGFDDMDDDAPF